MTGQDDGAGAASDAHTRGEYVPGLGWSCLDCDTFYCRAVQDKHDPVEANLVAPHDEWCWAPKGFACTCPEPTHARAR